MEEVTEIKGNLHLYEVEIQPFSEEEMACVLFDNGIDLRYYCGQSFDNLEDVKMTYNDFLETYRKKKVNVEGGICVHFDKMEE